MSGIVWSIFTILQPLLMLHRVLFSFLIEMADHIRNDEWLKNLGGGAFIEGLRRVKVFGDLPFTLS